MDEIKVYFNVSIKEAVDLYLSDMFGNQNIPCRNDVDQKLDSFCAFYLCISYVI